ncbi:hypothetical protein [Actinopolymorpha pittospori]
MEPKPFQKPYPPIWFGGNHPNAGRGRARMAAALNRLYGGRDLPDILSVAVYGPPEACVAGLRDVAEAGAGLVLLNPLFDDAEQLERLATEVVPQLS